jgi:hypothetical protein
MTEPYSKPRGVTVPVLFHGAVLKEIEKEKVRTATEYGRTLTLSRVVNRVLADHFGLDLDAPTSQRSTSDESCLTPQA